MPQGYLLSFAVFIALGFMIACAAAEPGASRGEDGASTEVIADEPPRTPAAAEQQEQAEQEQEQETLGDDETNEAHRWLDRIEQRAAEIDTLHARLRYVRVQGLLGDRQVRFGDLRYDAGPPQRFAIHFDRLVVDDRLQERRRDYIFDGYWLAELQHERRLFIRRELVPEDADEEQMLALDEGPFVLPLDLEKEKMLERFEVSLIPRDESVDGADAQELDNTVHLRLDARPHAEVRQRRLDVWYDRDSRLPVRVRGEDEDEDHWIIQLIRTKTGESIDEAVFDTRPPREDGWQVQINPLPDNDE